LAWRDFSKAAAGNLAFQQSHRRQRHDLNSPALKGVNMLMSAISPNNIRIGRKLLRDVRMCEIFYLGYGRNAWHGKWINRYRSDRMSFDKVELQSAAERLRIPGSVFKIESLPLLVLRTNRETFGICEINQRSPYEYDWLLERIARDGTRQLGRCLPSQDSNWLLALKLRWRSLPKAEPVGYCARSYPRGSYWSLGWEPFDRPPGSDALFLSFGERLMGLLRKQGRPDDAAPISHPPNKKALGNRRRKDGGAIDSGPLPQHP
jgi:hypothetical protein